MSNDTQLRHDVEAELDWDQRFDSRQIGVAVKGGVVALTGHVASYAERRAVEEAVQSIAGVQAVANDIVVELPFDAHRTDAELAEDALRALRSNVAVPAAAVKLLVREGWVTLNGEVSTWHQRTAAETALGALPGLKGINNNLAIRTEPTADDVRSMIEDAFRRRALLDARRISITASAGTVTLEGEVHSWHERQQAETAAWQAPGVSQVIDHLCIRP